MNKLKKKAFTLVELLVVIAILGILASVSIVGYGSIQDKAKKSNDETLLSQINTLMDSHGLLDGKFNSSKKALNYIKSNGIYELEAEQDGYQFFYNRVSNKYELVDTNNEVNNQITITDYRDAFNATVVDNKWSGYYKYSGPTTYTYTYYNPTTQQIVKTETINENNTIRYWLHVPFNYKPYKEYPCLTYVHGSGGDCFVQNYTVGPAINLNDRDDITYREKLLVTDANTTIYTNINDFNLPTETMRCFGGGDYDAHFFKAWLNDVKTNPDHDCFIIYVQAHDELWWENVGTYTIEGQSCKLLDARTMWKLGSDYGDNSSGDDIGQTKYSSKKLGPCPEWQLLMQVYDKLSNQYNINQDKFYFTGCSLGGASSVDIACQYPNKFACVAPVNSCCADINDDVITSLDQTRVYAYQASLETDGCVYGADIKAFTDAINAKYSDHATLTIHGSGHEPWYFDANNDNEYNVLINKMFKCERN